MDRLRPRNRLVFFGFTDAEIEKMEKVLKDSGEESLGKEFCQRLTKSFNRSSGRAGKPVIKWTEIQSWFQTRLLESPEVPKNELTRTKGLESKEGGVIRDPLELEFEARSSKDGAWYDVEKFLNHRFLSTGEAVSSHHFKFPSMVLPGLKLGLIILILPTKRVETFSSLIQFCPLLKEVRVRFIGFGPEEDEWVDIKNAVRERSVPLENMECSGLKVGDHVLCFQERRDQAIYYDAQLLEIQRKMHDVRGCRCLFLIRYDHDNTEDKVRLRRLCRRPRT